MTTPNRPPLWEVMTRARYESAGLGERVTLAVAAEIRAVAEWIKKARPDYDEALHGAIRADELTPSSPCSPLKPTVRREGGGHG